MAFSRGLLDLSNTALFSALLRLLATSSPISHDAQCTPLSTPASISPGRNSSPDHGSKTCLPVCSPAVPCTENGAMGVTSGCAAGPHSRSAPRPRPGPCGGEGDWRVKGAGAMELVERDGSEWNRGNGNRMRRSTKKRGLWRDIVVVQFQFQSERDGG
jgi:hypothetical protein